MRTGRTLTVFRWRPPAPRKFGGTPPRKIRAKSGAPPRKIRAKSRATPPPCGQTHACENITVAKTSFRPVKIAFCPISGVGVPRLGNPGSVTAVVAQRRLTVIQHDAFDVEFRNHDRHPHTANRNVENMSDPWLNP